MIIAHRGIFDNKNNIPENSILAFKKAIDKGYVIEFDVQLTKDQKLVVFHDDNVLRMTGINSKISDMTLEEVRKLKLLDTNELIPTFNELLDLVHGQVLLDIEIKNTKQINLVCDLVLKELENYNGNCLIQSFNPFIVKTLKKKNNKYKVGLLITKRMPNLIFYFFFRTKLIYLFKHDFIVINKKLFNKKYYEKHIYKKPIYVWTINNLQEASEYLNKYPKINCICNGIE